MFKKSLNEGQAGDNVGLLLRGTKRDDVERGQVVCKPGSIKPHMKFKGEIYVLTKVRTKAHAHRGWALLAQRQPAWGVGGVGRLQAEQAAQGCGDMMGWLAGAGAPHYPRGHGRRPRSFTRSHTQPCPALICAPASPLGLPPLHPSTLRSRVQDEGGRHTPFFTNYKPQFFFRTADVTGTVMLPEGTEMVMPGDNVTCTFELFSPGA